MTPLAKKVFELFGKPELAAETERKPVEEQTISSPIPWHCEHCGKPAVIEIPIDPDEFPAPATATRRGE